MRISTLLRRNLTWYWRTNLAVLLGVATSVGVLGGALLVGESVRSSLRDLVVNRLGNVNFIISGATFFREQLAFSFDSACPIIALNGVIVHEPSARRASAVHVYGVNDCFWRFQGEPGTPPTDQEAFLSAALLHELGGTKGDSILVRIQKASAIPLESLHGRKEDVGKSIPFKITESAAREFSLQPEQGGVRSVFVPLARLQQYLEQPRKANTILLKSALPGTAAVQATLRDHFALEDLGVHLHLLSEQNCLSLETDSALISDDLAQTTSVTAQSLGLHTQSVLTYVANRIRVGNRESPYSLVTALDSSPAPAAADGIVLNEWAARDLTAKLGDPVSLEYFVWKSDGRLHTEDAQFRLAQIIPIKGTAADRDLAPQYPGITDSESLRSWDPPFPLDLTRIRLVDEQYWKQYRTTPKAFVALAAGQQRWATRFGRLTSIRISPPSPAYADALRTALNPTRMGLMVNAVKAEGLEAAHGATDFSQYFVYFSFFLMASALLLTGLIFRLGIEQRAREIGGLRALGFSASRIRAVFLLEGAALAVCGALLGILTAIAYGGLILLGLRTWWFAAVGTRLLVLHISIVPLALGAAAGILTSLGSIAWALHGLHAFGPWGLLSGIQNRRAGRLWLFLGAIIGLTAIVLLTTARAGKLDQTAGFFGAGTLLLISALCLISSWLKSRGFVPIVGEITLGLRSAAYRPGRSILCIALIASATFIIVSVDAFRQEDLSRGAGGFPLMAESVLPLIHDPNTAAGRQALNIPAIEGLDIVPFRLRPGDDVSCLNLYQPTNPRILAVPAAFLRNARFPFLNSLAPSSNPWLLLESDLSDPVIPVIADANSMTYVLHAKLGQELILDQKRFRIVAALRDSIFQGQLLISEKNFLRLFPDVPGYRFFLMNVPLSRGHEVTRVLESALADYGFAIQPTSVLLTSFYNVANTYLSTFRSLGALGLVLGTLGLAAVLLRNVLERRHEFALLRTVGYRRRHLVVIVLGENVFLLLIGLATGTACALLAIAPAALLRGGHLPVASVVALLLAVLITGIAASLGASAFALRSPLLQGLQSE